MQTLYKHILLILQIVMLGGCNLQSKREFTPHDNSPPKLDFPLPSKLPTEVSFLKKTPNFLPLAEPECTAERALDDLGKVHIWLRNYDHLELKAVDLSGISGKGLTSHFTQSALYNYHVIAHHKGCKAMDVNRYLCEETTLEEKASGTPLYICRANGNYPRESLENAALATLAGIKQARSLLHTLEANISYPKINVLLQPKIETNIHAEEQIFKSFATDNAFWSVSTVSLTPKEYKRQYKIAILPHSIENAGTFKQFNLWEQKGILSHEYGHHFFYHNAYNLFTRFKPSTKGFVQKNTANLDMPQTRNIKPQDVIAAFNEAVADLIAHYSHGSGKDPSGTIIFGNFFNARNVKSCQCDDGEFKALSSLVLKHFFRPYVSTPKHYLSSDHQDIHTIGAILAHAFDKLLATRLESTIEQPKTLQKSINVIRWVRHINYRYKNFASMSPQDLLAAISFSGVQIAGAPDHPSLKDEQCQQIEKFFPVYFDDWMQNKPNFICQK